MQFAVLGSLEARDEHGRVLELASRRQRRLLAALLVSAGSVVSEEHLTDAVWDPTQGPASGVASLRTVVSRLRRKLHAFDSRAEYLRTKPPGYVLDLGRATIDSQSFERLVDEGWRLLKEGDPREAVARFDDALAHWRGDAFAEFATEEWARPSAVRLEERRTEATELRLEARLALGEHRDVIGELQSLVGAHSFRERPSALLIRALYGAGRQSDALRAYATYRGTLADELGLDPSPAMQQLEGSILRHDGALEPTPAPGRRTPPEPSLVSTAPAAQGPGSGSRTRRLPSSCPPGVQDGGLPRPVTEFVGRVDDVQRRVEGVAAHQLTTLIGPAGVGKTRLAIEVASRGVDQFPDGVWFADLAPIHDAAAVGPALASLFGAVPQSGRSPVDAIVAWVRGRRLLVLLDNCEHVLEPVRAVVCALMAVPGVTILGTSREPLGVEGECVAVVDSLSTTDAVELFRVRAHAADDAVEFSPVALAAVATICERLDGLPLAIELAAARVRSMTVHELAAALDDRLQLLRRPGTHSIARHRTLRAAVEWSHRLLDDEERVQFDRLSVFPGSFDLAAAHQICAAEGQTIAETRQLIDSLVDKSMVRAVAGEKGMRYRLLVTMRLFGDEGTTDRGETQQLRHRHLAHFQVVAATALAMQWSPRCIDAICVFDEEWDNFRAAVLCACEAGDIGRAVQLADALSVHANGRPRTEFRAFLDDILGATHRTGRAVPTRLNDMLAEWVTAHEGNMAQGIRLYRAALSDAHDQDGDDVTLAASGLAFALAAPGEPAVGDAYGLATRKEPIGTNHRFLWLRNLAAFGTDEQRLPYIAQLETFAVVTGSPLAAVVAQRVRAEIVSRTEPERAIAMWDACSAQANLLGRRQLDYWIRVTAAGFASMHARPDLLLRCRDMLALAADHCIGTTDLPILIGAVALATHGATGPAAALFGFHDSSSERGLNPSRWSHLRRRVATLIQDDADARVRMARGAVMARDEAASFALAELEALIASNA